MKRSSNCREYLWLIVIPLLISSTTYAQNTFMPQGIHHSGAVPVNTDTGLVVFEFTVLNQAKEVVYQETQSLRIDWLRNYKAIIGNGTSIAGGFRQIDWTEIGGPNLSIGPLVEVKYLDLIPIHGYH